MAKPENILAKLATQEPLLTPDEVAEKLRVSRRTVQRWVDRKDVTVLRIGPPGRLDSLGRDHRPWRMPESELQRVLSVDARVIL